MLFTTKLKKAIDPPVVFLTVSIIGITLFFVVGFFKGQILLEWLTMENNSKGVMLDYYRHILYSQHMDKLYDPGLSVSFPPLAYLFYYFIFRITSNGPIEVPTAQMPQQPYQMMIYMMHMIIGVLLLAYAVEGIQTVKIKKRLLMVCILFSVPMFAGAIERGNMALYVVALLLLALQWKDSGCTWKKEMALILIAVCAGLKVYPCIFGLLYLKEKRWKETARLIIYGVICFFVPFLFVGKGQFIKYIQLLLTFMGNEYYGRVQFFKGIISFLGIQGKTADLFNLVFIASLILFILCTRNKTRQMGYLAAFMALVPGAAYRYTLIYFLMAVFALFQEKENKVDTYVNAILLGLLFSIPTVYGVLTEFELNYGLYTYTYVEKYIYAITWTFVLYQFWGDVRELGLHLYGKIKKQNSRKMSGIYMTGGYADKERSKQ